MGVLERYMVFDRGIRCTSFLCKGTHTHLMRLEANLSLHSMLLQLLSLRCLAWHQEDLRVVVGPRAQPVPFCPSCPSSPPAHPFSPSL